ncbi:SAM-dependent methyltransferase [Nocardia asiatica]|uniref:SAM-dependent methyltransferase n=1 Tax=Nocardia asiatica TaxID=209252 RepID=UPI0024542A27|nr:SAM-dependent methyltransferase [Nocardia asiatica]
MTAAAAPAGAARPLIRTDIPHSARVWNYWMGGKDYYDIDQTTGDAAAIYPAITTMAVQSRQFLHRAVGYLTVGSTIRCRFPDFVSVACRFPDFVSVCTVLDGHWESAPDQRG